MSEETALYLQERVEDYPGVDIREDWDRVYLYAPLASHIIGYMGAVPADDPDTPDERDCRYTSTPATTRNEKVGASGIEKSYEKELRGTPGHAVYEVDAIGRVLARSSYVPPVPGQDIQLTIDLDIQQFAEQALETQLRLRRTVVAVQPTRTDIRALHRPSTRRPAGSVVVEEHGTGRIVAMASYPTFDNRWFSAGISTDKFAQLFPPEDKYDPVRPAAAEPARQPGDPGSLQRRLHVQAVHRLCRGARRPRARHHRADPFIADPLTDIYVDNGRVRDPDGLCNKAEGVRCEFKNAWNFDLGGRRTTAR